MSRKVKYKTLKAKKEAMRIAVRKWREANPEKVKEYNLKARLRYCEAKGIPYKPRNAKKKPAEDLPPMKFSHTPIHELQFRIEELESEMKKFKEEKTEILASLEEALKDSKKALDLIKWGKKK